MAKGYFTTTELLESIKRRASVPMSQITFEDSDLLAFADEEISIKMVPSILAVKEEFYVTSQLIPLEANKSNYPIPYRAIGSKVRHVFFKSSDSTIQPMANIPIDNIDLYQSTSYNGYLAGFYLQNNEINVLPEINNGSSGDLLLRYYMRPNQLVPVSETGLITDIDTVTGIITVDSFPSNMSINNQVDFIQALPNHKTLGFDITLTGANSSGSTFTVAPSDIPEDLSVGDYICIAGQSPIPQIPSDLHVMLAQSVACRVLEAIGDSQGLSNAMAKLQEMEQKLLNLITVRIEAPGKKVLNVNSLISSRTRRRWQ